MKLLFSILFFGWAAMLAMSQTPISDNAIRRTSLAFVKGISQSNYWNGQVYEVEIDYIDTFRTLPNGNIAIDVKICWTSGFYFHQKFWVAGYVAKQQFTENFYWFSNESSQNLKHYGRYDVGQPESEEGLIQAMGIGSPRRKKSEARQRK